MDKLWINSLSWGSLLGPFGDLNESGLYRHGDKPEAGIIKDAYPLVNEEKRVQIFENLTMIRGNHLKSAQAYVNNEGFNKRIGRTRLELLMLEDHELYEKSQGRAEEDKIKKDFYRVVVESTMVWPPIGLLAYDLATAAMLLRIGLAKGTVEEAIFRELMDRIGKQVMNYYKDAKTWCENLAVAHRIHLVEIDKYKVREAELKGEMGLMFAKESLWNNMEWPKMDVTPGA